jgi:hypothetical protein
MLLGSLTQLARSCRLLGILEFITGVEKIFDLRVLPDIRRGEILASHQWIEQPSIVTMKGGMWENREWGDEEQDAASEEANSDQPELLVSED